MRAERGAGAFAVLIGARAAVYDAAALARWTEARARDAPAAVPGVGPDGAPVLLAARAIKKGEAVVSLPEASLLTRASAEASPRIGAALRTAGDTKDWVALALYLIDESAAGTSSELAPWLAALPAAGEGSLDLPMFWDDDELSHLQGTQLLERAVGYREYLAYEYGELSEGLFSDFPDVFDPSVFTADALAWAFGVLRSRSHPPLTGAELALAPGADVARFSEGSQARWALRGFGPLGLGGGKALELVADRAYAEGEEITMAYGAEEASGTDLALDYGIYGGRAAEGYALSLAIPEDDVNYDDKADVAELNGLGVSQTFLCRAGGEMGLDPDFLPYMRLANCSGTDAFHLESLFRNEAWDHMRVPLSEESEAAVCKTMIEGCDAVLAGTESFRSEDRAVCREGLAGGHAPRRLLAALQREGERRALAGLRDAFAARQEALPTLEYYATWRLKSLSLIDEDGESTYSGNYDSSGIW
eukprot:PRCOL_00002597-RA